MVQSPSSRPRWLNTLEGRFLRFAAGGWVPASWYLPELPDPAPKSGDLHIEIVSHCWQYAHLLAHQLSSLVNNPPQRAHVTMTVFYNEEDTVTRELLAYFGGLAVPRVTWNWQVQDTSHLFRRAIGRNLAAKNSKADWVWFTDCDLMFMADCLDTLVTLLQGRTDRLVYPKIERCTSLLANNDPMLQPNAKPEVTHIETTQFVEFPRTRATGPLQITHGDIARACGYCEALNYYQQPSSTWCKAYEDRAFRWLLRTQGTPLDLPGVYRIRHIHKGRYTGSKTVSGIRGSLRRAKAWFLERGKQRS